MLAIGNGRFKCVQILPEFLGGFVSLIRDPASLNFWPRCRDTSLQQPGMRQIATANATATATATWIFSDGDGGVMTARS